MTPHGPWTIKQTRHVYRDPWVELHCDDVIRPDGQDGTHVVVTVKPGVSVLAMDDEANVYLTEEFHYAIGRNSIEVVSGGCEPGEDPLTTARRELEEELGIRATEWTSLGTVDPFTSMLYSPTALFLARGLSFVATAREGTEQIRCVKVPLSQAVEWVHDSRITHAPSCVAILKTQFRLLT